MIRHLIKLIWNKKRKNALLIVEIFLSFLVFFAIMSFGIHKFDNYLNPIGFEYENVWVLNIDWGNGQSATELFSKTEQMRQYLSQFPQVEESAYSGAALPFAQTHNSTQIRKTAEGIQTSYFRASPDYVKVLNIPMVKGRWFTKEDIASDYPPIVINKRLMDQLSPNEPIVGELVDIGSTKHKVIGVIDEFKSRHDYQTPPNVLFFPLLDTTSIGSHILLKMSADTDVVFEEKIS